MRLCPWSLALTSSIPVLGLESVCPRKGCPWLWPWPRIFLCTWPWPRALCPRLHLWSKAQRSIKYQGPLIWNALDADLKTCKTLQSFKAKLKNLLLQKNDQET